MRFAVFFQKRKKKKWFGVILTKLEEKETEKTLHNIM